MTSAIRSLALLSMLAAPAPLLATSFNFTISTSAAAGTDPATSFVASGELNGAPDPFLPGAFDITSISGTANGFALVGIVDAGVPNSSNPVSNSGFTFDNVLFVDPAHTDADGFLVQIESPIGISLAHVFFAGPVSALPGGYEVDVVDPRDPGAITPFAIDTFDVSTVSAAAVPESSTLAMIGTGIVGLAGLVRRRLAR